MKGFYRSKYTTPAGEIRYAAVTQFEVNRCPRRNVFFLLEKVQLLAQLITHQCCNTAACSGHVTAVCGSELFHRLGNIFSLYLSMFWKHGRVCVCVCVWAERPTPAGWSHWAYSLIVYTQVNQRSVFVYTKMWRETNVSPKLLWACRCLGAAHVWGWRPCMLHIMSPTSSPYFCTYCRGRNSSDVWPSLSCSDWRIHRFKVCSLFAEIFIPEAVFKDILRSICVGSAGVLTAFLAWVAPELQAAQSCSLSHTHRSGNSCLYAEYQKLVWMICLLFHPLDPIFDFFFFFHHFLRSIHRLKLELVGFSFFRVVLALSSRRGFWTNHWRYTNTQHSW